MFYNFFGCMVCFWFPRINACRKLCFSHRRSLIVHSWYLCIYSIMSYQCTNGSLLSNEEARVAVGYHLVRLLRFSTHAFLTPSTHANNDPIIIGLTVTLYLFGYSASNSAWFLELCTSELPHSQSSLLQPFVPGQNPESSK